MYPDQNPVRSSNSDDPRQDSVNVKRRPERFQDLLANDDFARPGWHVHFGRTPSFYLVGLDQALRLFTTDIAAFLKSKKYIDRAAREPIIAEWSRQSGVNIAPISLPKTREVREQIPQSFATCALVMVAFEMAIKDTTPLSDISPFWAYEFLRIRPAVYNIHRFDREKLDLLTDNYKSFEAKALEFCGQDNPQVLLDLATGQTVTRSTALRLKHYMDHHCRDDEMHAVGDVRSEPGQNSGLGRGVASKAEIFRHDEHRSDGVSDAAHRPPHEASS